MSDSNLENTGFFNQVTATLDYKPEVVNTLLGINSFGLPDKAGLEYEFINTPEGGKIHRFYLTVWALIALTFNMDTATTTSTVIYSMFALFCSLTGLELFTNSDSTKGNKNVNANYYVK